MASKRSKIGSRLGRDDWIAAAISALAEEGPEVVAIEPLARRLGVTKGSFYWHFADRQELWEAVLARWEVLGVDALQTSLSRFSHPRDALSHLVSNAFDVDSSERRLLLRLEVVLVALAERDPRVRGVYERIMRRRLDKVVELYEALGASRSSAKERGFVTFTTLLGIYPSLLAGLITKEQRPAFVRELTRALMPDTDKPPRRRSSKGA